MSHSLIMRLIVQQVYVWCRAPGGFCTLCLPPPHPRRTRLGRVCPSTPQDNLDPAVGTPLAQEEEDAKKKEEAHAQQVQQMQEAAEQDKRRFGHERF